MKRLQIIFVLTSFFLFVSASENKLIEEKDVVGTYGNLFIHSITLKQNHTFDYIDNSSKAKIETQGNWKLENEVVLFTNYKSRKKIPSKWLVINNGTGLKSKTKWTTYTLIGNCK